MDNLTGKAVLLYMAGYSPRQITRILGGESYPRLSVYLKAQAEKRREVVLDKMQDALIEQNKELVAKVKAAEWEVYGKMFDVLKASTETEMRGMSAKDKYLHVKTLAAAQKYVYNTLGIKTATDQTAAPKLQQINFNQYRLN